ncbi:MAG: glycoside hydrolase [Campylobacterales bacterium]|nr:glycoside hydrolase [Campylobacterales bacterium]
MTHNSLNLAFFWHMHQPDYRDSNGVMSMPWVFLHAIKDYYEMPWLVSLFDGVKASFNITAVLIEQLNLYNKPLENDYFLSLWHKDPSELSSEQKEWLIKTCKSTQYETMIRPIEYFDFLYHKESLDDSQLVDFEVVFMLSWCGNYLRMENEVVKNLFQKQKNFTQEDKTNLLQTLSNFTQTILPFYASLQQQGKISLATTPYNHPILPLLLDMNNAKIANEHTTIVQNHMCLRADAIMQVTKSIELFRSTFGFAPTGFWPAEGAVDEQSVQLYKEHGINWIATDEAILFRSLQDQTRNKLYKPYDFDGITIGFRDHGLSDLIGFTYRFKSAINAADHFMSVIEPIALQQQDATVFVILDGENAWEFFANNAYDFFTTLYDRFAKTSWCQTITMDEVSNLQNKAQLQNLACGSWIHGNFDTWSGHSEKNRAWELIYQTKRDFEHHKNSISPKTQTQIESHFLASECSDWFWWYGDDHVTEFASEFDRLFREHLISIYKLMQIEVPADLFLPIVSHKEQESFILKPHSSISPLIDGKDTSFFEWLGSGSIDETKLYSTMDKVRGPIEKIRYGQDDQNIYLAFEGDIESFLSNNYQFQMIIEENQKVFHFGKEQGFNQEKIVFVIDERIEMELPKLCCETSNTIHLRFEVLQGNQIIQTMPGFGALQINLQEDYTSHWFV